MHAKTFSCLQQPGIQLLHPVSPTNFAQSALFLPAFASTSPSSTLTQLNLVPFNTLRKLCCTFASLSTPFRSANLLTQQLPDATKSTSRQSFTMSTTAPADNQAAEFLWLCLKESGYKKVGSLTISINAPPIISRVYAQAKICSNLSVIHPRSLGLV